MPEMIYSFNGKDITMNVCRQIHGNRNSSDREGMLTSAAHEEDSHEGLNLLMVDDHIPAGAKLY